MKPIRWTRPALVALVLALAAAHATADYGTPPIPPPSSEPLEVQGERWAATVAREQHHPIEHFDPKRLAAEAKAAGQPGESRELYFERLGILIGAAYFSFAPLDAHHDDKTRYRLPFELDTPRYLVQGPNGRFTHAGVLAFDFAMPVGTPVLAAREGTVARVRDGFREGGLDPRKRNGANEVLILHADGTFAIYVHLSPGIPVHEGQLVKQGERIAASGNTGFTAGPHLHFAVAKRKQGAALDWVSIRFGVGSIAGFVPEAGQFYGGQPRRTVELVLSAGGAPISQDDGLRIAPGSKASITVSLTAAGAPPEDVTRSPATRFFTPTGWSLVVGDDGTVTASPAPDFAAAFAKLGPEQTPPGSIDWGVVVVSYTDSERDRYGFASVPVLVRSAGQP